MLHGKGDTSPLLHKNGDQRDENGNGKGLPGVGGSNEGDDVSFDGTSIILEEEVSLHNSESGLCDLIFLGR